MTEPIKLVSPEGSNLLGAVRLMATPQQLPNFFAAIADAHKRAGDLATTNDLDEPWLSKVNKLLPGLASKGGPGSGPHKGTGKITPDAARNMSDAQLKHHASTDHVAGATHSRGDRVYAATYSSGRQVAFRAPSAKEADALAREYGRRIHGETTQSGVRQMQPGDSTAGMTIDKPEGEKPSESGSKLDPLSSTPLSEQMPISSAIHEESHFTPEVFDQFYGKTQNGAVDYGSAYRGIENTQLKNLLEAQGFNKPPEKVDGLTFAGMKQQGWTLLARGISGDTQAEVEQHVEQFKNGESPFIGKGMFGDGTYYSSHDAEGLKVAAEFAQSTAKGESKNAGEVMSVALHPDANRITLDDLVTQLQKEKNEAVNARETATSEPLIDRVQWDDNISQFAAMKGYDAVEIPNPQINFSKPDGGMVNTSYWVVLNRGATAVLNE